MRVYKFLPAEWALKDIRERRLKITTFDDLNDPFELSLFTMSDKVLRRGITETKKHFALTNGILCFSRRWRNPVLWSHYADSHRGICLGFDVRDEFFEAGKYQEKRLDLNISKFKALPKQERLELVKKLLFTKYKGWSYEEEVRGTVGLKERDESTDLYFHNFAEKTKLREVIAGPLCTVEKKTINEAIGGRFGTVNIIKARLAFKSFDVVKNKRGFPP